MSNSEFEGGKPIESSNVTGTPEVASTEDEADVPLPADLIFDALSNERRQRLLFRLRDEEEANLVDIAEHIAAWENDTTIGAVPREVRRRVYTGLYHSHVPRLVDMGIVEFDRETDAISFTSRATQLAPYLDAALAADY